MHNEIVKEYNVCFLIKLKWNFVVSIDELGHKLKASNKKITLKHFLISLLNTIYIDTVLYRIGIL